MEAAVIAITVAIAVIPALVPLGTATAIAIAIVPALVPLGTTAVAAKAITAIPSLVPLGTASVAGGSGPVRPLRGPNNVRASLVAIAR
jgi:hypothetical protein